MAASLNKVILIGRLTRDPECMTFGNGGKVAKFGLAVNERKKDKSGQWADDPMFVDCEAYNRGEYGKLADNIETYCGKGKLVCVEGRLILDQWDDKKTGQKRHKHKIVADSVIFLEFSDDEGKGKGKGKKAADRRQEEEAGADEEGSDEIPF